MKYLFIIAIIFGISAVIFLAPEKHVNITNTAEVSSVKIAKGLPKLLDLGAHKCVACKKMEPVLEKLKKDFKGKLIVEFIDVWLPENRKKAMGYKIQYIPTQIFISKDGKEIDRHVGFISEKDILSKWKKLGYDFSKKDKGN